MYQDSFLAPIHCVTGASDYWLATTNWCVSNVENNMKQIMEKGVSHRISISCPWYIAKKMIQEMRNARNMERNLFSSAWEKMCQRPICISCLCEDHKKHEVREIEDHVKEEIITKVLKLMQNIHHKGEIILHAMGRKMSLINLIRV